MTERKIGFGLLSTGLLIMIVALVYVLIVFTGKKPPIALFNIPAPKIDLGMFMPVDTSSFGNTISLPKTELEILPTDQFNKLLNLSVTFFLMGFIVTFGYKIATLGVMFLRPVKVSLKEQQPIQPPPATNP